MKKLTWITDSILGNRLKESKRKRAYYRARNDFYSYMHKTMGNFVSEIDPGPIGPEEIIIRTSLLREEEAQKKFDSYFYFTGGYAQLTDWLRQLEKHNFNLRTAQAVFELGCGSARLVRHLRCIEGIRLVASDVKGEFVDWCSDNIQGIEFHRNELRPPLSFADDNSFDLVMAQSVFTHIPLESQSDWIREIKRILRPNGYAILNVLGKTHQGLMLSPAESEQLQKHGKLTLDSSAENASYSTRVIGSWDVFQTRGEILKAFGAEFSVLDYAPGGLDLLILRKDH